MANRKFGWHSGKLKCKDLEVANDLVVHNNFTFTDATVQDLAVSGTATFNGAATFSGAATFGSTATFSGAVTASSGITVGSGSTISFSSNVVQTTVGTAGSASELPNAPAGYLKIKIGDTEYLLPYYNKPSA